MPYFHISDNQKQNKQPMGGAMMGGGGMGQPQMVPGGGAMPNQMGAGGMDPLSSLQHMTFTPGMQPQQMGRVTGLLWPICFYFHKTMCCFNHQSFT